MKNFILAFGVFFSFVLNAENKIEEEQVYVNQINSENHQLPAVSNISNNDSGNNQSENQQLPVVSAISNNDSGNNKVDNVDNKFESSYKPLSQEELKALTDSFTVEEKQIFQEFIDFISNSFSSWKKSKQFEAVETMLESRNINLNILISIIPSKKNIEELSTNNNLVLN